MKGTFLSGREDFDADFVMRFEFLLVFEQDLYLRYDWLLILGAVLMFLFLVLVKSEKVGVLLSSCEAFEVRYFFIDDSLRFKASRHALDDILSDDY